ncbi:MAG: transporter substrate-binding domain-containing protein [Geminicoccaceae bacterium]
MRSMMTMTRRTIVLGATALLAWTSQASADDLMARGKADGLRVAYYNFAPFAYVDDKGDVIGEQVEILRHVLGEMGLKVASETSTEWGNLIPGLKADRFDVLAAGMFVTSKRCAEVAFTEPTFGIQQAIIVPKGNPKNLSNFESVRDAEAVLAAIAGTAQVDWAKSVDVNDANIMQIPDNPTGLAAVRAGRADGFTIDAPGARLALEALPEKDLEMLEPFGEVGGKPASPHGAYAVRPSEADFVAAFNKILAGFVGTPEHIAIMEARGLQASELPKQTTAELCAG